MSVFPDKLLFEDAGLRSGVRIFRLISHFRYISSYGIITVPRGFLTDGASIPKVFHSIMGPFGDYFEAAVIHDFLYSSLAEGYTRKEADTIFLEAMFNAGVPWYRRNLIYSAVRLGGRRSWKAKPRKESLKN